MMPLESSITLLVWCSKLWHHFRNVIDDSRGIIYNGNISILLFYNYDHKNTSRVINYDCNHVDSTGHRSNITVYVSHLELVL